MIDNLTMETIEDKKEWYELLSNCNNVNLLQTWEYGEAKQKAEGWIPIRSVLLEKDKPVGAVQTLVKRFPIIGRVARINRGPLVLSFDHRTYADLIIRILTLFYDYWVKQKEALLFIAPNILDKDINIKEIQGIGFRPIKNEPWRSDTVDLSIDEAILRKNLHQKWRNLLNKSERMGLELDIDSSDQGFSFLMNMYNETMKEKGFSGPSERLISEIRKATSNSTSFQVLFAVKGGIKLSGVLILGYLDTCHYLVGWNSQEGRTTKGNYFLLWQAILLFKRIGYRWFDLGGTNEKRTPTIAHFKKGIRGEGYTLIGEFEASPKALFHNQMVRALNFARNFR